MNKIVQFVPYSLLIIGTLGLLIGEFFIDLGRIATLTFAILNLFGLVFVYFNLQNSGKSTG